LTFGLVIVFLFRTRWGLAIRATSEDQAKAMAFGINARFVLLMVWGISALCIAVAGIMISNFGALSAGMGFVGLRAIPHPRGAHWRDGQHWRGASRRNSGRYV